jgi:hypothetical protein
VHRTAGRADTAGPVEAGARPRRRGASRPQGPRLARPAMPLADHFFPTLVRLPGDGQITADVRAETLDRSNVRELQVGSR